MVEFTASQRQKVNGLHGTSVAGPSNYRDASNSTGPWKNHPTLIAAPSQSRNARHGVGSPYDNMNNTLRGPQIHRHGNPSSRATLLNIPHQPSAQDTQRSKDVPTFPRDLTRRIKSSRLTNDAYTSSRHTGYPAASMSDTEIQIDNRPRGVESTLEHRRPEVIELSDEEDFGVPVPRPRTMSSSPDPLLLHDFETRPGHLQQAGPRKGKGNDLTLEPQAVTTGMSDIEEIEDFTSEPANDRPSAPRPRPSQPAAVLSTPSIRSIQPGFVAKKRGVYEPEVEVDLRNKNALSGRTGVAKKMKPKGTTKPASSILQLDPIATGSTTFTSKSLPRTKEPPLKLPLRAWAMGLKMFLAEEGSDPLVFEYDPQNARLDVSVPGQPHSYWFQQPHGFDEITVTNDCDRSLTDNAVIQLHTRHDCLVPDHGLSDVEFLPGSPRLSGRLTFLFCPDQVKGWITTYQKLVSFLTKSASKHDSVRPKGGKSLWEDVQRHADMCQKHISRLSNSGQKSIAPPIKSVSSLSAPHNSTVNPRTYPEPDAKPQTAEAGPSAPPRRSSRRSAAAATETLSEAPPLADPEELILVYPPSGPGALNIMGSDLNRLRPYEFLNDTLIEFGLKLWLTELGEQDPDLANQVHVFSSFFYKKLNNKKSLDEGYQSVKKWTSKVDIFSKKYIVVPINEHLHWYLAIIYEPEHTLQPPLPQKEHFLPQRGKLRQKNPSQPEVNPDTQKEFQPTRGLPPAEEPSEPDVEMASMHATCASTPSIMQNEGMDEISPVEFTQSCSISNIPLEKPRSASSSKPVSMRSRSVSVGKASGRSMSVGAHSINEIESMVSPPSPRLDPMDVDAAVIDIETDEEGAGLKGNLASSKASTSTQVSDPPSALSSKPPSRSTGIPVSRFYGSSAGKKGKQKPDDQFVVPDSEEENEGNDDEMQEQEVDAMLGGVLPSQTTHSNDSLRTRIFTLDSLGSRHPQAVKVLKYWLNAEAKDKRHIEEVRVADGKCVQVPVQPNFADCGIYLLHFTKTFLSKPAHYLDLIYRPVKKHNVAQRKLDWDEAVVQHYREDFVQRITQLSAEWKVSRAAKEEDAKRKRKSEELGEGKSDSSEVEVDIVENVKVLHVSPKSKQRPAKRMRG